MSEQSVAKKVFSAARDGRAITIFALLCQRSQCDIARILGTVTEEDDQKTTPFLIAARNGHGTVIRLFLSHYGVDIEQVGCATVILDHSRDALYRKMKMFERITVNPLRDQLAASKSRKSDSNKR